MKLIFCPHCYDIFKLHRERRYCRCGKVSGFYYPDDYHVSISREAVPLAFLNSTFEKALRNRPPKGDGEPFKAFVIAEEHDTIDIEE